MLFLCQNLGFTGFLSFLSKVLESVFYYGIPFGVGVWMLIVVLIGLFFLFDNDKFWWQKLEITGWALYNFCACYWFFGWLSFGLSKPDPPGYSHASAVISLLFFTITIGIPYLAKKLFIPFFITGFVYLGILIFGV
jgi:hypothetical protein